VSGETRSVVVRLSMEASNYIREAQNAGKVGEDAMGRVQRSAMSADQAVDKVGNTAGKVALGGIATLLATGNAAVAWESQWAGVTKTVDGTTAQMAELEDGLRDLATSLPATHEEIAGVAEAAGQLGVAREDVVDFTKTMVDLGETTNLTAEDAATSIAQISNVLGTTGEEVDNFGAALVALGNDGASTEKQILDMAQRIAGAGAQIGLAESDILAVANAAASMGIEAEAGGSAISRVFTDMAKATAQGSEKLDVFARVAGVSASEFAAAFEADPARAFASFTEGLNGINQAGGDVFTVLDELKLSDVRVSQALLGMAASGDLLTESLDLGAKAWEENTALTAEAEKRYATTASRVQVSWNEIKDAGIEAGAALLPVVSNVADVVGSMASAFGSLPGPVKTSLTGLVGITTVLGGGLWFGAKAVGAVTSMRETLGALGGTATGTRGKLGAVSSLLGGPWGIALGGATVAIGLLMNEHGKAAGYVDSLTAALEDQTGAMTRTTIATNLQDEGWLDYAQSIGVGADIVVDAALGSAEAMEILKDAAKADDSFFDITGDPDQFIANVEAQAAAQKEAEKNARLLAEANGETAASAGQSADATETLTDSTGGLRNMVMKTAEQMEAQAKALREAREAAYETASSFVNLGDGVDDAKVSLNEWIRQLANQADALNNFMNNAKTASKRGLRDGLIEDLQAAGSQGALRMKQLANATDEEIARANRAWKRGQDAMERYVDFKVPPKKIDVDNGPALGAIADLERRLRLIRDEDVFINVRRIGATTLGPRLEADGGYIAGPGTATSDSIPAYLSNGEYVIKAAAVAKYGTHMFDSLNAMHFADGGKADRKRTASGGVFVADGTAALEESIRRLTDVQESQTEAVERDIATRDEWAAKMADVAKGTISGFNTGLFDKSGSPWAAGAGGGAVFNLTKDIAGLNERSGLQSQLAAMGLSGDALAALLGEGSNADISGLIASGQVGQYASLYEQRAALQGSVGAAAGSQAYGAQYAAADKAAQASLAEQQKTNVQLAGLNGRLAAMEAALASVPERVGEATGSAVRGEAVKGHRDRTNRGGR
jgi:TP901 family phage tail tape measure protein